MLQLLSHLVRLNPGHSMHCYNKAIVQPDIPSPCEKIDFGTHSKRTSLHHKEEMICTEMRWYWVAAQDVEMTITTILLFEISSAVRFAYVH